MIDIRFKHRETGITFEFEEGQDSVAVKLPPSDTRVTTLTSKQLRELVNLLQEIADKIDNTVEVDYSNVARIDPYDADNRARRDEDIPF